MRLEQFSFLIEIADTKSMSMAAQRLHISQPAISTALKNFEDELGYALFTRSSKGMCLTPNGEAVYATAKQILKMIEGLYARNESATSPVVHIGVFPCISWYLSSSVIFPFSREHPGYEILVHSLGNDVIKMLLQSDSRFAVIISDNYSNLINKIAALHWKYKMLWTASRCILIGAGHSLAAKAELTVDDLKALSIAYYASPQDQVSMRYEKYFGSSYRLASYQDIVKTVIDGEAVFIQLFNKLMIDSLAYEESITTKAIPLRDLDHEASIIAVHAPDLTAEETVFWEYLLEHLNF